jgi:Uma2 family endonuclease
MSHPARRPATLEDLAILRDQGLAVELVDGEIVHKAMPKPEHGSAQRKLGAILDPFDGRSGGPRGPGGWWIMTEVEVFYPKIEEAFRHDLVGFRRDRLPARPQGLPVRERADWVCEILSPSTASHDIVTKQRTLHAHGVPHYWILDPEHETLGVLEHDPAAKAYVNVLNAGASDLVRAPPFEAIEIDVGTIFGHERD